MLKSFFVPEIFIHEMTIFGKNGQGGVQRLLYISRTVIAIKNLISYSESTMNFLSLMSHQILTYLSSRSKFTANSRTNSEWYFGIFSINT